jgi:hypothetical protein
VGDRLFGKLEEALLSLQTGINACIPTNLGQSLTSYGQVKWKCKACRNRGAHCSGTPMASETPLNISMGRTELLRLPKVVKSPPPKAVEKTKEELV